MAFRDISEESDASNCDSKKAHQPYYVTRFTAVYFIFPPIWAGAHLKVCVSLNCVCELSKLYLENGMAGGTPTQCHSVDYLSVIDGIFSGVAPLPKPFQAHGYSNP